MVSLSLTDLVKETVTTDACCAVTNTFSCCWLALVLGSQPTGREGAAGTYLPLPQGMFTPKTFFDILPRTAPLTGGVKRS